MTHAPLGSLGFDVSRVGLGCWQLGAEWGEPLDQHTAEQILTSAFRAGVTFFDTADVYGDGRSERLIGGFLRKHPTSALHVATKFGRASNVYPINYTEQALRKSVNNSRERLGVKSIDLLQLHCIPRQIMHGNDIWDWLQTLVDEGIIKGFGASVETVEEGLLCLQRPGLQSLQIIFNIFRQKPLEQLLPEAAAKGVSIIVRLPLASGLLTNKFYKHSTFDSDDHRNFNRNGKAFNVGETFAGLPFEKGVELAQKLAKNNLPEHLTMTQLSLRWLLDQEGVTTIIPGASSPAQAAANAQVAMLEPLSQDLHHRLGKFYQQEVAAHIRGPY